MNVDKIMKALFAQQRAQIIHMKRVAPDTLSNSYVYAWMKGVYPVFHDGDDSVPDYPHENFDEHFGVSAEFVNEVIEYLDKLWLNNNSPTFYELEDEFGGKDCRIKLIHVCRYAYLDDRFDEHLWGALLREMKHPAEARGITMKFDKDILYLL